ncbi:MAG: hypothetical protein M3N32_01215, partial [Actinomycetota bacterium]|nr:hypothetical protein [Actinomycetota bacterium]
RIEVKVIDIDTIRRRISLSLKQVRAPAPPTSERTLTPEQIALAETAYVSGTDTPGTQALGAQLRQAGFQSSAEVARREQSQPAPSPAPQAGEPALEGELAGQATASTAEEGAPAQGTVGAADLDEIEASVPEHADRPAPEGDAAPARAIAQAPPGMEEQPGEAPPDPQTGAASGS